MSRLASTALPVSLALASLCWPVAPALAGPTVKKLAWRTVAGTLETSWTGWRNTYGRTNLPVQRCDVPGQRFLVTEVRVTPTAFRGVAPGSPWTGISPEAAASLALWQVSLSLSNTVFAVGTGRNADPLVATFPAGITGGGLGDLAIAPIVTTWDKHLNPEVPNDHLTASSAGGVRFGVTVTGACGVP